MSEAGRPRRLEAVCLRDMALLAGLDGSPGGRLALRLALGGRARRFAHDMGRFDAAIGRVGLAGAAGGLARHYRGEVLAADSARVPSDGPILLVANHPGLLDALAIYATAPRPDLLAIARFQPLLGLLPEMTRHLLIMPRTESDRVPRVRALLRHLGEGGAALLFPAGQLEPEPALLADGAEPLGPWSTGLGALVQLATRRRIPLRVVPTAVSGVLSERVWRRFGPLIRLRRTPQARADLAALIQLAFPGLGPTTVQIRYGEPLDAAALAASGLDASALTERVKDVLRRGLRNPS